MANGEEDIAAASFTIQQVEDTFIEFDTFSPDPIPLTDYIQFVKDELDQQHEQDVNALEGGVSVFDTDLNDVYTQPINNVDAVTTEILEGIANAVDEADQDAQQEIENIFAPFTGVISTTVFPVLDLLNGIASGAIDFADLPAAVAASISNNIPFSLDFLANNNLADISSKASAMVDATVASGKGLLDGLEATAKAIIDGIEDAINDALEVITSIIIDPIASLLQAILDAIKGIPKLIAAELVGALLTEAPEPAA